MTRTILLQMSKNQWLKRHVPKWGFVRRAVRRFMPGERFEDALDAAEEFERDGIPAVFTRLGENITSAQEAEEVRDHYLDAIDQISQRRLHSEISVKLSHLGLDISPDAPFDHCKAIITKIKEQLGTEMFIDMESSAYVQATIELYTQLKKETGQVGLCIQAYLHRTASDIEHLFGINASLRLVKGAYREPATVAIQSKKQVDENFFALSLKMLQRTKTHGTRMIYATHDERLIDRIIDEGMKIGLRSDELEFQMLYGIRTDLQRELARKGHKVRVLIAYGDMWYPWYMRRLAERPANVWFVLKNLIK